MLLDAAIERLYALNVGVVGVAGGVAADAVWWITYAARWKKATQWAGPDALFTFALGATGQVLAQVPADAAFATLKGLQPASSLSSPVVPPLSEAMSAVVTQLKAAVPGDVDERHLNLFPLLLIHWKS